MYTPLLMYPHITVSVGDVRLQLPWSTAGCCRLCITRVCITLAMPDPDSPPPDARGLPISQQQQQQRGWLSRASNHAQQVEASLHRQALRAVDAMLWGHPGVVVGGQCMVAMHGGQWCRMVVLPTSTCIQHHANSVVQTCAHIMMLAIINILTHI